MPRSTVTIGASAAAATATASTVPARRGAARGAGVHSATSWGATTKPRSTAAKVSGPPSGCHARPGGAPNATPATSPPSCARSSASQGPGQLKAFGSAIGTSPSARWASQLRHTVHGSGCAASGTGTAPAPSSRIDASDAATDRCSGPPPVGGRSVRTRPILARPSVVRTRTSAPRQPGWGRPARSTRTPVRRPCRDGEGARRPPSPSPRPAREPLASETREHGDRSRGGARVRAADDLDRDAVDPH